MVDGADVAAIDKAVDEAVKKKNGHPSMIVLDTVKGNGVSCVATMENNHCIGFTNDLYLDAKKEISGQAEQLGVKIEWLK